MVVEMRGRCPSSAIIKQLFISCPVLSAGVLPEQQQVAGAGPGYEGGGGLVLSLPAGHPGASHPAAAQPQPRPAPAQGGDRRG